jgi:cell division protein FtsB
MSPRLLGLGALGLLGVVLAGYGASSTLRVWELRREVQRLEADNLALRARTESLARTVQQLRHDPAYLEKVAREDLGYVREGDTVLKFPAQPR